MSDETGTETKRIGRYEVRATLGHGGFAVVYRAWDPTLTREVALKVLHPHLAEQPEFRARFLNEARAIAGLDHPNILPVYEVSDAGEHPFFTMRLVHGDTLAGLLAEGRPLALARVAEIVRDLGSALDHLHAAGLVHRDLKPSNVMVEPSGRVSLMDFGIARISGVEMTGTSLIIGTPEYMAPEQCRGQPVGPAADIYALGALTYQLIAGHAPFECEDTAGLLFAHTYSTPQPLRELAPGLPERVYAVVESALEKDPAARPGSAGAFADALLDAVLSGSPPAAARPVTRVPPTQVAPRAAGDVAVEERLSAPASVANGAAAGAGAAPRRGRAPLLLAIGAATALLVGVVAVGLVVTRGSGGEPERADDAAAPVSAVAVPPASPSGGQAAAPVAPVPGETRVTTFAGSGQAGFADGDGPVARFNGPGGIAVDRAGNLYVADTGNQRIRKVAADGTVSTVAGSGDAGFADGPVTAARFNGPIGIAQGPTGALYVGDRDNHRIRRVVAGGDAITYAGTGQGGAGDGPSTAARLNGPTGLVFDGVGNLYATDFLGNQVRKVTPGGSVSTIAGSGQSGLVDGAGTAARFNRPAGIGIDRGGNLYVADVGNHRIRKITPDGVVSSFAGSGEPGFADGSAGSARFTSPTGVAVDGEGNVYVSDFGNHRIRRISPTGEVTTLAGTGEQGFADGPAGAARFDSPTGIVIDWTGNLYVAELGNRIRKITLAPGR